jgi:ABC-2 type transport system permease protein
MMTESQPWTIAALLVGEFAFNAIGYMVAHTRGVAAYMECSRIFWTPASAGILCSELALCVLLLSLTFFVQDRKADFL